MISVKFVRPKSPKFASYENDMLSLSFDISKSFYRIWVAEVSQAKL